MAVVGGGSNSGLLIKPTCDECGEPFLRGSLTTCSTCEKRKRNPRGRYRREKLRCDCGKIAVAVLLVRIRIGGSMSLEEIAVCGECMKIEEETVREYL